MEAKLNTPAHSQQPKGSNGGSVAEVVPGVVLPKKSTEEGGGNWVPIHANKLPKPGWAAGPPLLPPPWSPFHGARAHLMPGMTQAKIIPVNEGGKGAAQLFLQGRPACLRRGGGPAGAERRDGLRDCNSLTPPGPF